MARERSADARRLDAVVAARTGLTRSQARGLILAGRVRVDEAPATKPGANVREGAQVVVEESPRFVSRGGDKLAGALAAFGVDPTGADALD
ncbi:MAG: S4 domain-containing protein, partial [Vulcanimicrobiaceae bacterium]